MEPLNPVEVEEAIRSCAQRVASSARLVTARLRAYRDAERAYDKAVARSYLAQTGPAHARKYEVELAVEAERTAKDIAEVAFKYAERQAKGAELELSAWQTLSKAVNAAYTTHHG